MLYLKEANLTDAEEEFRFMSGVPADTNGFTNPYSGIDWEEFRTTALPQIIANSRGECLPEGYVPCTSYYLWRDTEIIGEFRLRQYLNDALREGAGHIGYYIRSDCRGNGYATAGLRMTLQRAQSIVPEDEFYLRVNRNNPASLKVMLHCGGYIHHMDEEKYYVRIRK